MKIVCNDCAQVELDLLAGRLACPVDGGVLGPWGYGRRRPIRCLDQVLWVRPRRARCASCGCTHVLLPPWNLLRRADSVFVIGAALEANAGGVGFRKIAELLGRAPATVRNWLRRARALAEDIRERFTRLIFVLDPTAPPLTAGLSGLGDAVEAIGRATVAAVLRLAPVTPWEFASRVTSGRLLGPPAR